MPQSAMRYEQLDHTADKGARVYGANMAELFQNAAHSMVSLMCDPEGMEVTEHWEISLNAPDRDTLFVRWLSELVYLLDVESLLSVQTEIVNITDTDLTAHADFAKVDREHFEQRGALVKAITYHGLELAQRPNGWEATYYVDV